VISDIINRILFVIALVTVAFFMMVTVATKVMMDFNEQVITPDPNVNYVVTGQSEDPFVNDATWYTDDYTDGY
jgi:hypothetical protein